MNLVHTIADPIEPRTRLQGFLRALGVATLVLLALADLAIADAVGGGVWPVLLELPLGMAAVLWPAGKRPAWLTPQLRTAVPAAVSLALAVYVTVTGRLTQFGPAEAVVLLCLLLAAVRTCPPRWAVVCAVLNGAALLALPLRMYRNAADDNALAGLFGFTLVMALLVGAIGGLGGYLRILDQRRRTAAIEIRRSERLAMAADLHDFVAHHVTGILVQTQVARMMTSTQPDRLDPVLEGIQHAATEALASMRRTVGILREVPQDSGGPESADRQPVGDLPSLADLVGGFGGPIGPNAVLNLAPSVPENLPHEVQSAAHRVVQEALTNVRRHAADATDVAVALTFADGTLRVTVRDNGHGGTQMPFAARGGGFGIVGLNERVTALGGELRTGPLADGGWEVVALLPAGERT
ncbi:sensor histidine kinase [Streptomyces variegatus]|uniref:sensor histidine kinase n=1 Tax=Streptomyces variegatus TaxID=284040 RepID=UPI003C2EE0A3